MFFFLNLWIFNLLQTKKTNSVLDCQTTCYLPNKTLCFATRHTKTIVDTYRTSLLLSLLWLCQPLETVCFDRGDLKHRLRSIVIGCLAFRKPSGTRYVITDPPCARHERVFARIFERVVRETSNTRYVERVLFGSVRKHLFTNKKTTAVITGHAIRMCREFIPTLGDVMQENEDDEKIPNASYGGFQFGCLYCTQSVTIVCLSDVYTYSKYMQ